MDTTALDKMKEQMDRVCKYKAEAILVCQSRIAAFTHELTGEQRFFATDDDRQPVKMLRQIPPETGDEEADSDAANEAFAGSLEDLLAFFEPDSLATKEEAKRNREACDRAYEETVATMSALEGLSGLFPAVQFND